MLKPVASADGLLSKLKGNEFVLPAFLVLLFTGAFLVRVWGMSYFHYWDEMVYLQDAKVICCGKTNYSELAFRPPLLSLLFAGVFLVRDHMFAVCAATAALNALAPILLFLSGRRIVGTLASALGALLLAFGPFFVGVFPDGFDSDDTGNSLLTDSPALTLVLLGLWLMLRGLEKQRLSRFFLAGFGLALAVLMRFGSIPAVGPICLLTLLARERPKALIAALAGIIAGVGPYLLWSRLTYGDCFETLREGWKNVEGPEPPFTFYLAHLAAIFTWIGVAGLILAAGVGLLRLSKFLRAEYADFPTSLFSPSPGVLLGFLWLWLLTDFAFFSRMPHKEPRYILPLAGPLLLLSGYGLAFLCRLRGRLLRPGGLLLLAGAIFAALLPSGSRFSGPFVIPAHPEEMDASAFLESRFPRGTRLYMNFNYPAFAYGTGFGINILPIGGPEVYRAIDSLPKDAVLIAYRENESGEPKIDALNRDPHLEAVRSYRTLVIYRRL